MIKSSAVRKMVEEPKNQVQKFGKAFTLKAGSQSSGQPISQSDGKPVAPKKRRAKEKLKVNVSVGMADVHGYSDSSALAAFSRESQDQIMSLQDNNRANEVASLILDAYEKLDTALEIKNMGNVARKELKESFDLAIESAQKAVQLGSRLSITRETLGVIYYHAEKWPEAIRELKTAIRISANVDYLSILADSFRGLGNPEKVIELNSTQLASRLSGSALVEFVIVLAGAYVDLGDYKHAYAVINREYRRPGNIPEDRLRIAEAIAYFKELGGDTEKAQEIMREVEEKRARFEEHAIYNFELISTTVED